MQQIKKVFLFSLLLLTSCGESFDPNKITLPYKVKGITEYITLTNEESLTLLFEDENENNLILVSYALPSCTCWVNFKNDVLLPFIKKTEVPVYVIDTNLLTNYYGLNVNASKSNTPVFGLYEEGVYKYGKSYTDESTLFEVYENFYNYVTSYVNLPTNY